MKTKIIYISGSEVFNMNDVRMAFDTVRQELGLGTDTILFGVPVDKEDALGGQFESVSQSTVAEAPITDDKVDVQNVDTENTEIMDDVDIKPKRTRKKATPVKEVIDTVPEKIEPVEAAPKKEVIPILSVLNNDEKTENDMDSDVDIKIPDDIITDDDVISMADMNTNFVESDIAETDDSETTSQNISFDAADIDDEIPTVDTEPTSIQDTDDEDNQLEKLLQSVQSLHEDKDETQDINVPVPDDSLDETDATLEMLANEFAENQDKIVNTTKSTARGGRIGKLKNILPFKKAKHNDSGLMGDLFGWAGVAANDEEFAIPEFFPTAAKK